MKKSLELLSAVEDEPPAKGEEKYKVFRPRPVSPHKKARHGGRDG